MTSSLPKVLHVSRVGFLGGVERVIVTLATRRAEAGRTIVAGPGGGDLERLILDRGTPYIAAPVERSRITRDVSANLGYPRRWRNAIRAIDRICETHRPDVIHVHHPITVLQTAPAARVRRIPIVFHVHEIGPPKALYRAAMALALRCVARVACVSGAGRDLVRASWPPGALPVEILHNGVDPTFHDVAAASAPAELGDGGPHIGVFGVLEPRKGQDVLLRALAHLQRARRSGKPMPFGDPVDRIGRDAVVWLVGTSALADKTDYLTALKTLANSTEIRGSIRFTGHRDDVVALMKAMDVVVQPSVEHESLSMVLLEALTLGRPVVGTDVGGSREAIRDGVTGLLVPPGDGIALIGAINRVLGPDGGAMARTARDDAATRFSTGRFLADFEKIYASVSDR